MALLPRSLILITCLVFTCHWSSRYYQVDGQRNLLHWKRDLEFRINLHHHQRMIIDDIVASSIYTAPQQEAAATLQSRANVILRGNVRFTDLVIPDGSLILEPHVARSTARILHNKTRSYVSSKMNELDQIRNQLDTIQRQLEAPGRQVIDKGYYNMPVNNYTFVRGNWMFKQFMYGRMIESQQVDIGQINHTNVDRVINETYMDNMQFGVHDSRKRLLFEGKKTFRSTVFLGPLKSGCCERMSPLHTDRMMIKSRNQNILAPVVFQTNNAIMREAVHIRRLSTNLIYNSRHVYGMYNRLNHNGLLTSPAENIIQLANLINIRQPNQTEILKTLVFRDVLIADEVHLDYSPPPHNRLMIGVSSDPRIRLDLANDNYLLKFFASRKSTQPQHVAGSMYINSETLFMSGLESDQVNGVQNFTNFVLANIVRVDRPANISGVVQFDALPSIFIPTGPSRSLQAVKIMRASRNINVGLLNGMRIPDDIFIMPSAGQPLKQIRVRGPRHFMGRIHMDDFVYVRQSINGMQMPEGVIPLHLNDFMGSVGTSRLWFLDGIDAQQIITESGQFDDIKLRDVHNDAKNLIFESMIANQPDGTRLIKAPMRVTNLIIQGDATKHQGLLNGFRPDSIMELNSQLRFDSLYGRKTFLAPVTAADCVFTDINHLANWTNHLIRIDRPNTVQTVHTTLAFAPSPVPARMSRQLPSSIYADRFSVDFYPNTNPSHYTNNLNFSPELFILQQALLRGMENQTGGRYRVIDQVRLMYPQQARINGIGLNDIVTLDRPITFADRFVMVGKVDVAGIVRAHHITSNYPIDAMDLVQFDKYRIPIIGSRAPIRLNNLVLSTNNRATFVQCRLLNGISFNEFANSIMSLTRPQVVDSNLVFRAPVNFEGLVRTGASLNGLKQFKQFIKNLKTASYSFEDGLQCNSVILRN